MSSLVRSIDDVPAGVSYVECPQCNTRAAVSELVEEHDFLLCPECGKSGLVPRSELGIADRYPASLARSFTPVTNALFDPVTVGCLERATGLRLKANDRALIVALETHRRPGRDWVWPSIERLAVEAGCTPKTVSSRLGVLVEAGLLLRELRKNEGAAYEHYVYSLAPFWEALAHAHEITRVARPTPVKTPVHTRKSDRRPPVKTTTEEGQEEEGQGKKVDTRAVGECDHPSSELWDVLDGEVAA